METRRRSSAATYHMARSRFEGGDVTYSRQPSHERREGRFVNSFEIHTPTKTFTKKT